MNYYALCMVMGFIFALQYTVVVVSGNQVNNPELLYDNSFIELCPHDQGSYQTLVQNGMNRFEGQVEVCKTRSDTNHTLIWKLDASWMLAGTGMELQWSAGS